MYVSRSYNIITLENIKKKNYTAIAAYKVTVSLVEVGRSIIVRSIRAAVSMATR